MKPKGKPKWGTDLCLTGRTQKPRKFLVIEDGNKWHWWNRRAAWDLWKRWSEEGTKTAVEQMLFELLELAFSPE